MDPRHQLSRITAIMAVAILAGCSSGGDKVTPPPDPGAIGITVGSPTLSLAQGAIGTVQITVSRTSPFAGTVNLSLEGAPTGVTGTFSSSAVAIGATTSTLTINVGATTVANTYTLTVKATGTGVTDKTATVTLTVSASATPAFSLAMSPGSVTIPQGGNGTVTATIARTGGFTGAVGLAVTGGPTGLTGTPNPASITLTTSTITIAAAAATTPGTFTLTVTGTGTGVTTQVATISVTVTAVVSGNYTLTVAAPTATLAQGGNTTVAVTINRTGGFTGAVALGVTGGPTGFTGTPNPASTTGNTSTVTLAASATAAAGTYTVTVTGTSTGLANQTVTVSVTITVPGGSGNVTFQFCANSTQIPVWVGFQDGNGPWTRVTLNASNVATFNITQGRGGVAYVTQGTNGSFTLIINYSLLSEMNTGGTSGQCVATPATKTLTGTVAGLGAMETALVTLGGSVGNAAFGQLGFTLNNVADGASDLFAGRTALTVNGQSFTSVLNKLIIRRSLNPANGSVLPVLDFGAAEAFDPIQKTVTLTNAGADQVFLSTSYVTANTTASFFTDIFGTGAVRTYYGVPAARQAAGDLHGFLVSASNAGASTSRIFQTYFKDGIDRTIALGPNLNAPTVSSVSTAPYVRLRTQLATQTEFNRFYSASFSQGNGATQRLASITATAAFAGTTFDLTIPDFTAAGGFDANWALKTGATQWSVFGYGWTGAGTVLVQPVAEGAVIQAGVRTGSITP